MKIYTRTVWDFATGELLEADSFDYEGPVSEAKGGGSTQVTKSEPWEGQMPYLTDTFGQAQQLYRSHTPQYYPGQTLADFTPAQTAGQQQQIAAAQGPIAQLANGANASLYASLDPMNNPLLAAIPYGSVAQGLGSMMAATAPSYGTPNPGRQDLNPHVDDLARNATAATVGGYEDMTRLYQRNFADQAEDLFGNYQQQVMGAGDQALAHGQYGATRHGVAQGIAGAEFARQFGRLGDRTRQDLVGAQTRLGEQLAANNAQLYGNAYDTAVASQLQAMGLSEEARQANQQAALNAGGKLIETAGSQFGNSLDNSVRSLALAPGVMQANLLPGQTAAQVGGQQQAQQQAILNDAQQRWDFYQQLPYNQLSQYANLVQGNTGGGSSMQTGPGANPLIGAVGGAAAGAGLLGMTGVGGGLAMANPYMLPVLAGGALLGGLFS